ncbi:MAG: hypothetical protein ABI651_12900, partial [Verrucomicrobiota bacterium]
RCFRKVYRAPETWSRRAFRNVVEGSLSAMNAHLQFLLLIFAAWVNRQQQAVIEYLQEENRILLEQLGGKHKRFTDAQRMRLARKAKAVGRRRLKALTTIVTPMGAENLVAANRR